MVTNLYITLTDFILMELKTDMFYKLLDLLDLVQMFIKRSIINQNIRIGRTFKVLVRTIKY